MQNALQISKKRVNGCFSSSPCLNDRGQAFIADLYFGCFPQQTPSVQKNIYTINNQRQVAWK